MKATRFNVSEKLAHLVAGYMLIESSTACINRVLPATGFALAIPVKGHIYWRNSSRLYVCDRPLFSGLLHKPRLIQYSARASCFVIEWKPEVGAVIASGNFSRLFNETVDAATILPLNLCKRLEFLVQQHLTDQDFPDLLETTILQFFQNCLPEQRMADAVQLIRETEGHISIPVLARSVFMSQDGFEKKFKRTIGATPKQFANLVRFRATLSRPLQHKNFASLALDTGYADQSHFNHQFLQFSGLTPGDYFAGSPAW